MTFLSCIAILSGTAVSSGLILCLMNRCRSPEGLWGGVAASILAGIILACVMIPGL